MGTRSLTFVYEGRSKLLNMYRQYDGYPSGHGLELAEFLGEGPVVNGFGSHDQKGFNGMPCLAAQLVAHFKKSIGGFYIYPTKDTDCGQEYEYHVRHSSKGLNVTVYECSFDDKEVIFKGGLKGFKAFCQKGVEA
jgi:hypothetical protein